MRPGIAFIVEYCVSSSLYIEAFIHFNCLLHDQALITTFVRVKLLSPVPFVTSMTCHSFPLCLALMPHPKSGMVYIKSTCLFIIEISIISNRCEKFFIHLVEWY